MTSAQAYHCWSCGKPFSIGIDGRLGRREECGSCGADLHSCRQCHHYDAKAYNECREPSADVIQVKDRANFCDFFRPRAEAAGTGQSALDPKAAALAAAEALFKKKP